MNINNRFSLGETVYIYATPIVIHKISLCQNWVISYFWYNPKANEAEWYEEWQITNNIRKIWFETDDLKI